MKQSSNAERKERKEANKRKSTHDTSAPPGQQEARKSSVAMRSSQPKIAKRASPAHAVSQPPVPQTDDADEYEGDEFEDPGTATKPAGGRQSQAKEIDEDQDANQKVSLQNVAASQ